MKRLLTLALLFCTCLQTRAYEWTDNKGISWTFSISNDDAILIKPTDKSSIFGDVTSPPSVTIPYSVESIGDKAFIRSNVKSVCCYIKNPLYIEEGTFSNRFNTTLYVLSVSIDLYKSANYWKQFKMILPFESETTGISHAIFNYSQEFSNKSQFTQKDI